MMSARGSSPKMPSETVTEPASPPSSVVTFNSMSGPLLRLGGSGRGRRGRRCGGRLFCDLELAGLRRAVGELFLHRVAHRDPAAFDAGHRALHHDQPASGVGPHHLEIERGHPLDPEMAGHLLVFESLARILPATGRAVRAVRDGHAVAGAQAAEIPALHRPRPTLAGGGAGHVYVLADHEV